MMMIGVPRHPPNMSDDTDTEQNVKIRQFRQGPQLPRLDAS